MLFPQGEGEFERSVRRFQGLALGAIVMVLLVGVLAIPLMLWQPTVLWVLLGMVLVYLLALIPFAIKVSREGKLLKYQRPIPPQAPDLS
ncbi:hypothetical protein [Demequina aurantiaca]|uniref:hypothetical protein n=1 Tax=Demequina aurantiaca TaxID=676200 RepID=UPI003D33C82B